MTTSDGHRQAPFEPNKFPAKEATSWRAHCSCGWTGPWQRNPDDAQPDFTDHAASARGVR